MKPTNYKQGEKYPLLLEIHGGPAMWGPGQESMWHEYQYFCSKGYGIVYSNPRGSGATA
jgi:dipeptidyl aminopeptidase/acylaminoacyl peptidase